MESSGLNRRDFSRAVVAFFSGVGLGGTAFATGGASEPPADVANGTVSHTAEAIHQEVTFKASRKRVYDALTDAKQFNRVVQLSTAGMSLGNVPTAISKDVGGAFSLYGGHITGRHIELVPDERIVQAWRAASWSKGVYSIVKFELAEQGSDTTLIFDHTGFPDGQGQHLAEGWKANYWDPLEKYLPQQSQ